VINVFIVAEIRLYEEGLAYALRDDDHFSVGGTAFDPAPAVEQLAELDPPADVVLVDASLDQGRDWVREAFDRLVHVPIVVLGVRELEADVIAWAEAGAAAYVPRQASLADLKQTLEHVVCGETLASPRIVASLLRRIAVLAEYAAMPSPLPRLTSREREIAVLIHDGLSNKEIASRLSLGVPTVKNHVHNILEKLQVSRRGQIPPLLRTDREFAGQASRDRMI
jgi:DNA-binding NarL/FixJ family response regulator